MGWLDRYDRKTENSSEKPNNLSEKPTGSTISKMEQVDWKDQMWKEAVEQREHDILYEPTYDIDDGSM